MNWLRNVVLLTHRTEEKVVGEEVEWSGLKKGFSCLKGLDIGSATYLFCDLGEDPDLRSVNSSVKWTAGRNK